MPTRLSKATILVVDDEVSLRQLIVRQLRSEGYTVLEAGYGMEALAVARTADRIHLVLSDIRMPGMLGTELAKRMLAEHPSVRVVLMSAHALHDLETVSDGRGIVQVLTKPFDGRQMLAVIELVLDIVPAVADTTTTSAQST